MKRNTQLMVPWKLAYDFEGYTVHHTDCPCRLGTGGCNCDLEKLSAKLERLRRDQRKEGK